MSLVNNSANNFKDFLDAIKPYLNYQFYDLSGQGVEANNYSTDEKVIGTWIDGKPLYQKVIDFGTLPSNSSKAVDHNISNLGMVCSISGVAYNPTNMAPIPFLNVAYLQNCTQIDVSPTQIIINTKIAAWAQYTGYVTLRYTKTTDTAVASGEKIVGQWVDGKPVYEKLLIIDPAVIINNQGTQLPTIANADAILEAIAYGSHKCAYLFLNNSFLAYYDLGVTDVNKVKVRYTKTTD